MIEKIRKKPTLADVAALAGVSKMSASKALLGGSGKTTKVSEATRERIQEAAAKLHYIPNTTARNLATNCTGFIAYILSDKILDGFNNSFFNRYLAGVEEGCRKHGYGLYTTRSTLTDIKQVVFPSKLRERSVDGLIAVGEIPNEVFKEFARYQLPILFLNRSVEYEKKFATFCADSYQGLRAAVTYAYNKKGCKNIWFCRVIDPGGVAYESFSTCVKELEKSFSGLRVAITERLSGVQYNEEVFAEILLEDWKGASDGMKPDFLFGDPKIVASFLGKLDKIGIKCPDDIKAMASSDGELNRFLIPKLSTVDYNFEKIGADAVDLMVDHIKSGDPISISHSRNDYSATIIERESTES